MTAIRAADNRDVIPRWRTSGTATRMGELGSHIGAKAPQPGEVDPEVIRSFRADPGDYTAGELVASFFVVGGVRPPELKQAAELILASATASLSSKRLAYTAETGVALSEIEVDETPEAFDLSVAQLRVARMRHIVQAEPFNSIRWVDLSLAHATLGNLGKAERGLQVALGLTPNNRHALRAATRFYVLKDDPERAYSLLSKNPASGIDPWLQAAELALSEVVQAKHRKVREARAVMDRPQFSALDVSELASELATAEMRLGRMRHARRYMRDAMRRPTENALAQAEWATRHGIESTRGEVLVVPRSFEADAYEAFERADYARALSFSQKWQADQPFAGDAAIYASYVATMGAQDWRAGIGAAEQGLIASPNELLLRNNLIFALANNGETGRAREELGKLPRNGDSSTLSATVLATRGLVEFREGLLPAGRAYYSQALAMFRSLRQPENEALAAVMLAREEASARTDQAEVALARVDELLAKQKTPAVSIWRDRVSGLIEKLKYDGYER